MSASTAATAVLKPAVTRVATAAFQHVFGRIKRLNAMERATVRNERTKDAALARISSDIAVVVGRNGELTQRMASFLSDFANSGLIDQLAIAAITEVATPGSIAGFNLLYESHFSQSESGSIPPSNELYEKLRLMIRASLINEENIELFIAKETFKRLRDIGVTLEQISRQRFPSDEKGKGTKAQANLMPWHRQQPKEIRKFLGELGKALVSRFDKIRIEGPAQKTIDIDAEKIYVASELVPARTDSGRESFKQSERLPPLEIDQFLSELDRAVILGDPGGGKTTTARMICRDLIRKAAEGESPFPIFVTLRKFYATRSKEPSLPLLDYILRELAEQSNQFTVDELRTPILHLLVFGKALVIFDGLDEILSVSSRREFLGTVTQFCSLYHLCRYIVTSRKVGYDRAPLSSFPTFELAAFDGSKIRKYVRLSAEHVFHRDRSTIDSDVRRFMAEAKKHADEFIHNPLLLSLIVWLYNSTQRIPDNRAEIYSECSQLLFERWDSLRELYADVPDAHRLFGLLAHLAEPMYLNPELQKGSSGVWLKQEIRAFFITDYSDNREARATYAANRFVEHLAGRAWVLREIGHDEFEFTHRTFLEYFFARQLINSHLSLDELIDSLSPHIVKSEWNVPAHLAIQMWVKGKRKHAEHAVTRLVQLYSSAKSGPERTAVVDFIAQAIEYLQPPEVALEHICKIITLEISDDTRWKQAFQSLLQTPNEMRRAVLKGLASGFAALIERQSIHRVAYAFDWLKAFEIAEQLGMSDQMPARLVSVGGIREHFAEELVTPLANVENSSAAACKARFDVSMKFDANLVASFGLRLWQASSELPLRRLDWRMVDSARMLIDFSEMAKIDYTSAVDLPYARFAVAVAESDLRSYPMSFGSGRSIVFALKLSTLELLCSDRLMLSARDAAGLCFALMMYGECHKEFASTVRAKYDFQAIQTTILNRAFRTVSDPHMLEFVRGWQKGLARLFSTTNASKPVLQIGDILR
ncbi:MAG TPA: NACHT domain-containing protein [Terriglobales bacterium]|nr:NACHT domain-containing protein [Terriglobales bacterium]